MLKALCASGPFSVMKISCIERVGTGCFAVNVKSVKRSSSAESLAEAGPPLLDPIWTVLSSLSEGPAGFVRSPEKGSLSALMALMR